MTRIVKLTPEARDFCLESASRYNRGALTNPAITVEEAQEGAEELARSIARAMMAGVIVELDGEAVVREVPAVSLEGRECLRRQGRLL